MISSNTQYVWMITSHEDELLTNPFIFDDLKLKTNALTERIGTFMY